MDRRGVGAAGTVRASVMLNVTDLDRAIAFWRDVIGLREVGTHDLGELVLPGGAADGPKLLLHPVEGTIEPDAGTLGFDVNDIRAAIDAIAAGGGRAVRDVEDYGGIWHALAADPDGNTFQVIEYK